MWKLVGYATEPEFTGSALPNAPPVETAPATPLPVIAGDPAMLRAATGFFSTWLVQKDPAAAFRQVSPASYTCYNNFRAEDAPIVATQAEGGKYLLAGMTRASELVGTAPRLEDLITAIEPHHPDLKLVKHASSSAFTVVGIADTMAAAVSCDHQKPGIGPFYAASIRFKRAGADGAVLWTLWAKESSAWKVVSYLVIAP